MEKPQRAVIKQRRQNEITPGSAVGDAVKQDHDRAGDRRSQRDGGDGHQAVADDLDEAVPPCMQHRGSERQADEQEVDARPWKYLVTASSESRT